jgi:hypothetical protein
MQHGVAVRAHRTQVSHRINSVAFSECAQWAKMVNMNKPLAALPIGCTKVDPANRAVVSPVLYACSPCARIPLVPIHLHTGEVAFGEDMN